MKKVFKHNISLNVVRLNKLALGIGVGVLCVVLYVITTLPFAKAEKNNTEELHYSNPMGSHEEAVPRELLSASNAIPGHEQDVTPKSEGLISRLRSTSSLEENDASYLSHQLPDNDELLKTAYKSPLGVNAPNHVTEQIPMELNNQPSVSAQIIKISPYTLHAGSLIPSIMQSGINSDLPGEFIAIVRHHVFDSTSGKFLLIPQGSRLILMYDNRVVMGQQRLIVAAKRLIFPNGNSVDLGSTPTIDDIGMIGLKDNVDNHYGRIFGSSLLIGLISGGVQLAQPKITRDHPTSLDVLSGTVGQQLSQTTLNLIERQLTIQPTLVIRPGQTFNIQLSKDLVMSEPYEEISHDE